jgi:hypothetical protein
MVARHATKNKKTIRAVRPGWPDHYSGFQLRPQQFLYFLPLPQGHGSFLPTFTRFT